MAIRKKTVTIREVAERAGVSIATVSYILNGKTGRCSPETLSRIEKTMEEMGFEPDLTARSLAQGLSRMVGLVLPLTRHSDRSTSLLRDNPFYGEFYDGLNQVAAPLGFDILLTGMEQAEDSLPWAKRRNLDGLIYLGSAPQDSGGSLASLPILLVDALRPTGKPWPVVRTDDLAAAREGVASLISMGHRRIAFVSGAKRGSHVNGSRYKGYCQALEAAGLDVRDQAVLEDPGSFEGGYRAAARILEGSKDSSAVFCAADVMAFGMIRAFQDKGLSVPGDVSVMGFDDLSSCRHFAPLLSTVSQDIAGKGRKAAEILIGMIEGKTPKAAEIIIPHAIKLRDSTGRRV